MARKRGLLGSLLGSFFREVSKPSKATTARRRRESHKTWSNGISRGARQRDRKMRKWLKF